MERRSRYLPIYLKQLLQWNLHRSRMIVPITGILHLQKQERPDSNQLSWLLLFLNTATTLWVWIHKSSKKYPWRRQFAEKQLTVLDDNSRAKNFLNRHSTGWLLQTVQPSIKPQTYGIFFGVLGILPQNWLWGYNSHRNIITQGFSMQKLKWLPKGREFSKESAFVGCLQQREIGITGRVWNNDE